jgi:hypothetical protein
MISSPVTCADLEPEYVLPNDEAEQERLGVYKSVRMEIQY